MDATPLPRVDESGGGVMPAAQRAVSFADVVRAWHARGEPVPVAVVASVFDDVLSTSIEDDGEELADLDAVRVTPAGRAHLSRPHQLSAESPILMEALGADLPGDSAVPPAAWGLFDRLTSDDPLECPADAEQLRQWLRDSLGTPASHEEVRDCVFHALMSTSDVEADDDVHELETLPPHPSDAPLPIPSPAADEDMVTLPPERAAQEVQLSTDVVRAREQPRDVQPRTDVERATHLPEPLPDSMEPVPETALPTTIDPGPPSAVQAARQAQEPVEPEAPLAEPLETAMPEPLDSEMAEASAQPTVREGSNPDRPVVRHKLARALRPVSVVSAPAARRSARSSPLGSDSILVPADQKKGWAWVAVAATIAAAVYFLFFR